MADTVHKEMHAVYPRVFVTGGRHVIFGLGWALIAIGVIGVPINLLDPKQRNTSYAGLFFAELFLISLALWLRWAFSRQVLLDKSSIEVASWFSRRKLDRDKIRGHRMQTNYIGSGRYILFPTDTSEKPMFLPPGLEVDKYFLAFIEAIPVI